MGVLRFCSVITIFATIAAALIVAYIFFGGFSAPQEAAGAALALAICVIPYIFTRMAELDVLYPRANKETGPQPENINFIDPDKRVYEGKTS